MLYIKIGDNKYSIKKFSTFVTQFGNEAIRIIGDVPLAESGFLILDEEDNVISDRSDFIYLYREDDECKEYTKVVEEIIPTNESVSGDTHESPYSILSHRISDVNNKVDKITPYVETKMAYIDDTEIVFENEREGNILISAVDQDNNSVDALYKREGNNIVVSFLKPLEQITKVTLSIQ